MSGLARVVKTSSGQHCPERLKSFLSSPDPDTGTSGELLLALVESKIRELASLPMLLLFARAKLFPILRSAAMTALTAQSSLLFTKPMPEDLLETFLFSLRLRLEELLVLEGLNLELKLLYLLLLVLSVGLLFL